MRCQPPKGKVRLVIYSAWNAMISKFYPNVLGDNGNEGSAGRSMVGEPRREYRNDTIAATAGLSPTNFTPQYYDIDRRLLDGWRETYDFYPRKIAPHKGLFENGSEQAAGTLPVDTTKRHHIEETFTARGLTLLSEYPVTSLSF